jgi:hypothetical protein
MKFRGKTITASSLLTLLGVVCFASVLVAAAVISSGVLNWSQTVTQYPTISLAKGTLPPGSERTGVPVTYAFTATVAYEDIVSGATVNVWINLTGIASPHAGTTVNMVFDGVTYNGVTLNYGTGSATATQVVHKSGSGDGVLPIGVYTGSVIVTYTKATSGTPYSVDLNMSGTIA